MKKAYLLFYCYEIPLVVIIFVPYFVFFKKNLIDIYFIYNVSISVS